MKNSNIELKTQIIASQTESFWRFCNDASKEYHEREKLVADAYNDEESSVLYSNDTRVIADSIQEFSQIFFKGLAEVLKEI